MPPDALRRGAALAAIAMAAIVIAAALLLAPREGGRDAADASAAEALCRLAPAGGSGDPVSEDDADEQASGHDAEAQPTSSAGFERPGPRRAAPIAAQHAAPAPPEPRAAPPRPAHDAPSLVRPRASAKASPESPRPPPSTTRA